MTKKPVGTPRGGRTLNVILQRSQILYFYLQQAAVSGAMPTKTVDPLCNRLWRQRHSSEKSLNDNILSLDAFLPTRYDSKSHRASIRGFGFWGAAIMSKSITTRRRRVSLLGGVSLLTLLCSGAAAEPLLPAIDIGSQAAPDSGAASPPPQGTRSAQPAAGPAQPAAQPLGDWPGASTTTPPLMDGSAAAGYRVKDTTGAGPIWGDLPLQDTPYSITVVPSPLIENLQAYSIDDLVKVIPQVTNAVPLQNINGNSMLYLRGFEITQFTNNSGVTYDGMLGGAGGMFYTSLEDKERVEVLSGVNGFLYGTGSVGGNINYVLKRPTATPVQCYYDRRQCGR